MALEIKMGSSKNNYEPGFEPYRVKEYDITEPLTSNNSGFSKWGFCTRNNKTFFIKEFLSPKYPEPDAEISETRRKNQIEECTRWFNERQQVYNIIMHSTGGNIVEPVDFFRFENNFYLITNKIDANAMKFEELYRVSSDQRHIVLKVLANEFAKLAAGGIVHSDIKPSNLMLKTTVNGYFTVKIIDFDDSFREQAVPYWDDLHGDLAYFSPEAVLYMDTEGEEGTITTKSDVFSLGILFHQILCGEFPEVKCDTEFTYIGEAVLNGGEMIVSNQIPEHYGNIIEMMLCENAEERISMQEVFEMLCEIDKHISLGRIADDPEGKTGKKDAVHNNTDQNNSLWRSASFD